ncbi:c-type cytochrome, partial [Pseudomonas aeruginosa]
MNMPSILSLAVVGLLIAPVHAATAPLDPFQPPAESSLPDNAFGEIVRQGQALFVETRKNAPHLVGNQLNCVNCHLEQGRRANSAPQWAAYPVYPAFRAKNNKVNTFAERLQGCFQFSMNGKVPAADSPEIK